MKVTNMKKFCFHLMQNIMENEIFLWYGTFDCLDILAATSKKCLLCTRIIFKVAIIIIEDARVLQLG
jgi:hypothetical protein